MQVLVTGGAGFIGRWVVKKLLSDGHQVCVLDDLSNGRLSNLDEFRDNKNLEIVVGDIKNKSILDRVFNKETDLCLHLGASIIVQDSIDNPKKTFENDVIGTFNILEKAREFNTKFVFMSTCIIALVFGVMAASKRSGFKL